MEAIDKIDKQIELERAASTIYARLEAHAPDPALKNLWRALSVHEMGHIDTLEKIKSSAL